MEDETTELQTARARALVERGLGEARAIGHPILRGRHVTAWAHRLSALDPAAAAALEGELPEDPGTRARLLLTVVDDRLERGDGGLEADLARVVERSREVEPDSRLRLLNVLCEVAIELGERDREQAVALLRRLAPEALALGVAGAELQHHQALACALVGEALVGFGEDGGWELLEETERLGAGLPARDPLVAFLASAYAERNPERAAELAASMEDPGGRLEAAVQVAEKAPPGELRTRLLDIAEADGASIAHFRGPEVLVRLGHALVSLDPDRARRLFDQALEASRTGAGAMRGLQLTGVGSALSTMDRERAGEIYREAVEAVGEEADRVRRVTSFVVIANEMAESHPREAAELFARAMEEAAGLDSMWEYAHVLDIVFRADRSPYLDVSGARGVLEAVLARLGDDDLRIPGVFGLPDAARLMLEVDRERAVAVLHRWYDAGAASGDTDGMTQAALALHRADPEAGRRALEQVRELLTRRIDCPAMGEFSHAVAPVAPDLVLTLAPLIPDRRGRTDATTAAALGLYEQDPERALELLGELERPADRSTALLTLADRVLNTSDRPQPEPLLEDMP